ncbi:MAG: hypothetical protein ACK4IK_07910 [Bacteroidia bacterium]
MKALKKIFAICIILKMQFYSFQLLSQSHFNKEINYSFEKIYNYYLLTADTFITNELNKYNSAEWQLMKINVAWWQIVSGYNDDSYWNKIFLNQIEQSIKQIGKSNLDVDKNRYYYIILHAFKTRYDIFNNKYFSAVNHLNSCLHHIKKSFDKEEEFEPFYLTSGLYYYFMAKAWEDYPLMRPYLRIYPKGDKVKGLGFLYKMAKSNDIFLKSEANYFLMRIFYDLEKQFDKAAFHAEYLLKLYPENIMYRYYLIKILEESGKTDEMKQQIILYKKYLEKNNELRISQKKYLLEMLTKKNS